MRQTLWTALTLGVLSVSCVRPTTLRTPPPGPIWQLTYLKAANGRTAELQRFIEVNWFAMDQRAVRLGVLVSYHLFRGTPADTSWDLLEVTTYKDSLQHARVDSIFRVSIRPAHTTLLVDGLNFRDLGRIVRSETARQAPHAQP